MNEKRIVTTNIIYKESHNNAQEILKKINEDRDDPQDSVVLSDKIIQITEARDKLNEQLLQMKLDKEEIIKFSDCQ